MIREKESRKGDHVELYVGGSSQGKLSYVLSKYNMDNSKETIAEGSLCTEEELFTKKIINHFHEYIKGLLEEEKDVEEFTKSLLESNPGVIILSNEVGYGVVPMEKKDRVYREEVGRCLCRLAKEAVVFERIVCGFGMRLK
jgi:hypothetical protein